VLLHNVSLTPHATIAHLILNVDGAVIKDCVWLEDLLLLLLALLLNGNLDKPADVLQDVEVELAIVVLALACQELEDQLVIQQLIVLETSLNLDNQLHK